MKVFWTICLALLISGPGSYVHAASGNHPTAVKVLTLDDRPPNFLMVKQIGAIAGVYIDTTLGDSVAGTEAADLTGYELISLNAAVAGSLVGSRTADPSALHPPLIDARALVHFAVPRAEPTVKDEKLLKEYEAIRNGLADYETQVKVAAVVAGESDTTGDEVMDEYSRRLTGWLDFLGRADIDPDRLLITLDDNRPGPLADRLKLMLRRYSHHVMDGTDEGMMLLFARWLREHQPYNPSTVGLIWTSPGDLMTIAPYESGFVFENLLAELDWLKGRATSRLDMLEAWRPVLWVNGAGEKDDGNTRLLIKTAAKTIGDRRVVVANIAEPNSGDQVLMDIWRQDGPPPGLVGYLGWNTSSNTLGSAVVLWAALDYGYATRPDPATVHSAAEVFLWARLLDDWLYQGIARQEVREEYVLLGANPWGMTEDEAHRAAGDIAQHLVELWREKGVDMSIPLRIVKPLDQTSFIVELPWRRFFEINLYPTDDRSWIPQITPF